MRAAASVERFFQFSLLGMIGSAYFAVAGSGHLDLISNVGISLALVVRILFLFGLIRFHLPERWVAALTIAYFGFYPFDFRYISDGFLGATVHLVIFVAVMRVLSAHGDRQYFQTAIISLLLLLAAALLSIQLNFFVFLGLYLLFAIGTLTSSEIRRSARRAGQIARAPVGRRVAPRLGVLTGAVALGVLLLTGGLFFLLPRTAHAALRHLASSGYFLPGFSNEVTLGQIGEIKTNRQIVMHVQFPHLQHQFHTKWRGAALAEFDGRKWFNADTAGRPLPVRSGGTVLLASDDQRRRQDGLRLQYRVDLNPLDSDALFFAGTPEVATIPGSVLLRTSTGGYRIGMTTSAGFRYDAVAFFEEDKPLTDSPDEGSSIPPEGVGAYLTLPQIDHRIRPLAAQVTAGLFGADAKARALERHLRTQYRYTLQLPERVVADPVAYFLFERRKGHCEYFASAMAVMLRTLGIPSRMVTGFQSGEYNPVSERYIVRASDAHSWVEAYIPQRGWVTYDPTPPDPSSRSMSLIRRLGFYFDAAETFWQDWVLSYDLGRQLFLADRMEQSSRRFRMDWFDAMRESASRWNQRAGYVARKYAVPVVGGALLLTALIWIAPGLWRRLRLKRRLERLMRGEAPASEGALLYAQFLDLMKRRGHTKPSWFTPAEFVRTLSGSADAPLAERFTAAYQELRFGGKLEAAPRLSELLEQMERGH